MKMKYAAVASICVLAVLCSSASVLFASDSDADAAVYDGYYKNQLTPKQVEIYTALTGLTPSVAIEGNETDGYYITVSCTGLTSDNLNDIERAWFATKLEASETSSSLSGSPVVITTLMPRCENLARSSLFSLASALRGTM